MKLRVQLKERRVCLGSDNSDMSDYTDNRHRVYHGRLLAYIQTTGGEGPVKVKFASPLLKGTEVKFEVGQ